MALSKLGVGGERLGDYSCNDWPCLSRYNQFRSTIFARHNANVLKSSEGERKTGRGGNKGDRTNRNRGT